MASETILSSRVARVTDSVTLSIASKAKEMKAKGLDIVDLSAGEPDFDTPHDIKEAAIQAIQKGFTKYTPSSGTQELRVAIADKFKKDNSLDYPSAQIIVSSGAKHSLYNIFQVLCEEGDEVIIPSPYWLSYPEMVKMAQATPVFVGSSLKDRYKISARTLESRITKKTKAVIINSPSNPTGSVYSADELKEIAAVAVRHKIYVISDEIYEKLIYDGKKHVSIASLGKDIYDLTIVVNGMSKAYSMTGWRVGYAAGPAPIMKGIASLQSHATSNPCSISQAAALAALIHQENQQFIEKMRQEFQTRRDYLCSRILAMKTISCVKPDGAFYVFCDVSRTGLDSLTVTNALLEEALVAVIPGKPFGDDGCIRLSFATSMETIKKGIDRIEAWAAKRKA